MGLTEKELEDGRGVVRTACRKPGDSMYPYVAGALGEIMRQLAELPPGASAERDRLIRRGAAISAAMTGDWRG